LARWRNKEKYHLIKWEVICKSKKKGGQGIKDLRKLNISLMCKWWWKLEKEEGLWQQIVKYKYLPKNSIHDVCHEIHDSPMWADLLKVKNIYLQGRAVSISDETKTRFWHDPWLFSEPIASLAPVLFALCENKDIFVAQALQGTTITFRRWLHLELWLEWDEIWRKATNFQLTDSQDDIF
jgi:hypothetical protein